MARCSVPRASTPAPSWARPRSGSLPRMCTTRCTSTWSNSRCYPATVANRRPPTPTDAGWKDTVDLRPGEVARVIPRFDGYKGRYVFHCHNLEHEDMMMMANFEVL